MLERRRTNRPLQAPSDPNLIVEIIEKEITTPPPSDTEIDIGAIPDEYGRLPSQRRLRHLLGD